MMRLLLKLLGIGLPTEAQLDALELHVEEVLSFGE